jgi:hypothetical protein
LTISQEVIDTLQELRRLHALNEELLEQLSVSCKWLLEHNALIPNAETLSSLLKKATALLSEIGADKPKILQYQAIRRNFTGDSNPTETSQNQKKNSFLKKLSTLVLVNL